MIKTHYITKLRVYKADGKPLEFIVGEEHTGAGVVDSISHDNGDLFHVYFKGGHYTVLSGFPYVYFKELK